MSWNLACADFTFPLLPHAKTLQLISMLDFQGVDIGLFEGRSHLWPSREFADLEKNAARLRNQLAGYGLVAADLFLQMAPDFAPYAINHPDPARRGHAREWFSKTLAYAAGAGATHVTTLPGVFFEEEPAADSYGRALDELQWRVEEAGRHGIVFGVEAHVGSIAAEPQRAVELVEQVAGLTLTLDYTHFVRMGMADTEVDPLVRHASHFHVRGAQPGRLQSSFKDNIIDYARVLQVMRETGYQGWLGVEYVWIDWEGCNECDNLSETILFRDHLKRLMDRDS